jgi:hypothetical protein
MPTNNLRGEIAEAAFLFRALCLGHTVFRPFGEKAPYDCVIDNGRDFLRIQIKSSAVLNSKTTYHLKVQHGGSARRASYTKQHIDVLAVYILPEDTFYLFPVEAVANRASLSLPSAERRHRSRYAEYHEAFHLLEPSAWIPNQIRGAASSFWNGKAEIGYLEMGNADIGKMEI